MRFDKETIFKTKEKYLDFIAEWPNRFLYKGKNFKELFTLNDDLSLWWLTEMQMKDPECSPVFENLCRLEQGEEPKYNTSKFGNTVFRYIFSRSRFLIRIFLKVLIFKFYLRRRCVPEKGHYLFFVSAYPIILKQKRDALIDRNFLDLPEKLEKELGINTKFITFYHGSVRGLLKEIRKLKDVDKILFFEEYLNIFDLCRAFDMRNLIKYIFVEKKKIFQNTFDFDGYNIFALFKDEFRNSFLGRTICESKLLFYSLSRILPQYKTKGIITFLEMYPYSKALYYSAKRYDKEIKTIAYQHAAFTSLKLWYAYRPDEMSLDGDFVNKMPVPDLFIFNGRLGKDILLRSGYPEERCFLVGSLRLDSALEDNKDKLNKDNLDLHLPSDKKAILVTTSSVESDSEKMVSMLHEVSAKRGDCVFIFKTHPNCPLDSLFEKNTFKDFVISNDNVYRLISKVDVLVTSYSTTAEEAIALGCPVISIDTGELINMSVLFDIPAAPVVHTPDEFNKALDMVFYNPKEFEKFKRIWPELIEASFYKLDGKAKERFITCIREKVII